MSTSQVANNQKANDNQENKNDSNKSTDTGTTAKRIRLVEFLNTPISTQSTATSKMNKSNYQTSNELRFYDPPYLKQEPPFPNYEVLNINIKGYDHISLDQYYKFIEKLCNAFKVDVSEAYAMPARSYNIKTYQPFSLNLDKEYTLKMFHRIVRINNLKSTIAPILFESIQLNLPEGVHMTINVPDVEEEEFRYIPDIELNELKNKLDEMSKKPKADVQAALQEEAKKQAAAATAAPAIKAASTTKVATSATKSTSSSATKAAPNANTKTTSSPTKK
jgi:large subunit ribosomal protein L48